MFQVMSFYLENGMKIYLHQLPNVKILTAGIIVHHGSINETDENSGITHFIEHLVMNKNTSNKNILNLFDQLLKYGTTYNAETTKDSTFFYFNGLSEGLNVYLNILRQSLYNNRDYTDELFNNEKKVVLQEFYSHVSSFNQIQDRTMEALYGETGLGRMVIGREVNIKSFEKEKVINKIEEIYTPENCSLMIIGDFKYEMVTNLIYTYFNDIEDKKTVKIVEKVNVSPGIYHNPNYKGKNSILSMGFRYYEREENGLCYITMRYILNSMCNFIISRRIIYVLREKMGLIYSSNGFVENNRSFYSMGMHYVFDSNNLDKIAKVIIEEIINLKDKGFEEDEFELIKSNMITRRLQERVNMSDQVYSFSKCIKNNTIYSPENDLRIIKNLIREDANKLVNNILNLNNLGIACIGNCDIDSIVKCL